MAKPATATKTEDDNKNIVLFQAGGLPSTDFASELEGVGNLGYSEKAEDGLVPIVSILQDNSGEAKKKHSRSVEGAEAGHLIIRSIKMVLDPINPLYFQPCAFDHQWVAWKGEPGEGVVTGHYPFDEIPEEAEETTEDRDDGTKVTVWKMEDGSRLVDTRYHYGFLFLPDGKIIQAVLPMAGTNHTVSRGWTQLMKMQRLPGGKPAPSWFMMFRLDTKYNERGTQSWWNYDINLAGWVTEKEQRDAGKAMNLAASANTIQADVAAESTGGDGADSEEGTVKESDIPI